jgi:hypothetical protein
MVILPVSRKITMPCNDKYQFLIIFMEVLTGNYLTNFQLLILYLNKYLKINIEFNLLKDLPYKLYRH